MIFSECVHVCFHLPLCRGVVRCVDSKLRCSSGWNQRPHRAPKVPHATILPTLKSQFGCRHERHEVKLMKLLEQACTAACAAYASPSTEYIVHCRHRAAIFLFTHCLYLGSPPKIESCATQHALPHSVALLVGSTRPSDTAQTQHCRHSSYFRTEISLNVTMLSLLSTSMFTVHLVTVANHPNCSTSTSMDSHARPVLLMRNYMPDLCYCEKHARPV